MGGRSSSVGDVGRVGADRVVQHQVKSGDKVPPSETSGRTAHPRLAKANAASAVFAAGTSSAGTDPAVCHVT